LIFEDNFDFIDFGKWQRENTLSGGGNWEFQWYAPLDEIIFSRGGHLFIEPDLMVNKFGDGILTGGDFDVTQFGPCTDDMAWGCERNGNDEDYLNPIISGKIQSRNQFSFKYGIIEYSLRLPAGDWLWPAVWMMPKDSVYGGWPDSGEVDLVEGRGNRNLYQNGEQIGSQHVGSTLHNSNGWRSVSWNNPNGFVDDLHTYRAEWHEDHFVFIVDNVPQSIPDTAHPFDQEFYLIINLAIGGTNYFFPDDAENPGGKPWLNTSYHGPRDFWQGRDQWLPTWVSPFKALEMDYIRVWAY